MIPKADGDPTPLGQRPLCVLPVVYQLWASLRLSHLKEWVKGWVPQSVFSVDHGVSAVDAWLCTALDIGEILSGRDEHLHVLVADVVKSFDTVNRPILDCALVVLGWLCGFGVCIFRFMLQSS